MNSEDLTKLVPVPPGLGEQIKEGLGLAKNEDLRICYIPGPGDVVSTYDFMCEGRHDPRVPSITFSLMFFSIVHQLKASAQVCTIHAHQPKHANKIANIQFTHVPAKSFSGRFSYYASQVDYARALAKAVKEFNPHIVVASTNVPKLLLPVLSRNRKLVLETHNTFWPMGRKPTGMISKLKQKALIRSLSAVDDATCASDECRRQILDLTKGRVNGEVHYPQLVDRHTIRDHEKATKFLYLGRIEESKGIPLLIEAFARAKAVNPDITLTIAGSGSYENVLITDSKLQKLGINYLGKLDSTDVHKVLDDSDALICPTTTAFNEGLALVVFEALGHGLPSIISSVVPARDALGENCIVFEANSVDDLARKISDLAANDDKYKLISKDLELESEKLYDRSRSLGACLVHVLGRMAG